MGLPGFLIVFLGAGLGGALRHAVNLASLRLGWTAFPASTLVVNVLGSFLMGVIVAYAAFRSQLPQPWVLFLTTGLLGGFTTFSAFSLDTALLHERGQTGAAAAYVAASVFLSVGALFAALALTRHLLRS